jgi:baculoviral IAP repeat-containing protein 6
MPLPHGRTPHERTNGTGYGGEKGSDRTKLLQGRRKAATAELKLDKETLQFFILTKPLLASKSASDTSKLVSLLKQTFRKQVPTDWAPRKQLFMASLACFRLVVQNYSELLGDKDDSESLNAAFEDFAEHAHFLDKHGGAKEHALLVKEVLEVQSLASQRNTHADILMMDPHAHYRKALGPLRFDFVDSLVHHHFASSPKSAKLNTRKMFQELSSYKTSLPIEYGSSIFVRAVESRLDLLRALILGPEDTPYANGCFFFDIHLKNYPGVAPAVHFLTTGGGKVRFNPNLYNCGKVCLSLLGTWSGPGWISGESTLLQVMVSIQSLIFVNDPYFNEPGYAKSQGTPQGTKRSDAYNANLRTQTLLHAIKPFVSGNNPYPEFDEPIQAHFRNKKLQIEKQMYQWMAVDPSHVGIVQEILPQLARFNTKPNKTRDAKALPVAASPFKEVNGVIELLDDGGQPHRKKHKPNEVVVLLDDGDSKPAARVQPVVLDLT